MKDQELQYGKNWFESSAKWAVPCPHCLKKYFASDDEMFSMTESSNTKSVDVLCQDCRKKYTIKKIISIDYEAKPL